MTIVSGRVRVNRPYFYTDTKGNRAEFPAMGEGTADLDGHELARFDADVSGGMIEQIDAVAQPFDADEIHAIADQNGHGIHGDAQPVTKTDEFTRESIAAMNKADVLDLLDMHGWDGDKRLGVDKLRAALIDIMFVDL